MDLAYDFGGFTRGDRLGLSIFGSILMHMFVILGISFTVPVIIPQLDRLPTLDITLVNTRSDEVPEKVDYLAQANQDGGGDTDLMRTAKSPLPLTTLPSNVREPAKPQLQPDAPQHVQVPQPEVLAKINPEQPDLQLPNPVQPSESPAATQINLSTSEATKIQQERAKLAAELAQFWDEYQKRPRRKFLSARTREYKFATYMEAWRAKVERIGNLNYPESAKRDGLIGTLILDVAINPDGTINEIQIERASPHKTLNDAARRIVKLAAPFEAFPEDIRAEVDILHITRTWQFIRGNRLTSR
ncbi:MAG: TonB family protein [Gammaproteobacteria bacterium]|nr:TonB family protein [Gammaproteobacteria bacterium]MDH3464688.1 TonB family protein [Gammaproteobacteria bacterium]